MLPGLPGTWRGRRRHPTRRPANPPRRASAPRRLRDAFRGAGRSCCAPDVDLAGDGCGDQRCALFPEQRDALLGLADERFQARRAFLDAFDNLVLFRAWWDRKENWREAEEAKPWRPLSNGRAEDEDILPSRHAAQQVGVVFAVHIIRPRRANRVFARSFAVIFGDTNGTGERIHRVDDEIALADMLIAHFQFGERVA